jgi:putative transposase
MARPLRLEFPGALYHLTARGNARQTIFQDDTDRQTFLDILGRVIERYGWSCRAYCLMGNHYHLLLETPDARLSAGMQYLNGVYTQAFNRRHSQVGHLLQGRFKAILVEKDAYLLELARYIVLNPVRAGMVRTAKDWPWSSYRATAGLASPPALLHTDPLLAAFGRSRRQARLAYRRFVAEGRNQPSVWPDLKNQIYLGSEAFVERMRGQLREDQSLDGIPKRQCRPAARPLADYQRRYPKRKQAMAEAYLSGHYSLAQVGAFFGVSYATVSRAVKGYGEG